MDECSVAELEDLLAESETIIVRKERKLTQRKYLLDLMRILLC